MLNSLMWTLSHVSSLSCFIVTAFIIMLFTWHFSLKFSCSDHFWIALCVCFWTGQGGLEIRGNGDWPYLSVDVHHRVPAGDGRPLLTSLDIRNDLSDRRDTDRHQEPDGSQGLFRGPLQTLLYEKRSFYLISSFDERYSLVQGSSENAMHCYSAENTSHLSLNAWHLPLSNCTRVLSSPCKKSRTVSTAICKINLWERGKAYVTLTGGSSIQFTLYPLSNCSMNRRLHFVPLSTAIISKVRRQLLFIYNFLKSLKTQCFWYCGGCAIMHVGSVYHMGQLLLNGTWEK